MLVRPEEAGDRAAVHAVNEQAFDSSAEADIVDRLRDSVVSCISLVADEGGEIVGHILFSPVYIEGRPELRLFGLAPMAVMPGRQRQGIGTLLVRAGLEACRAAGVGAIVVLGHPNYYPRFGFEPGHLRGIDCEFDAPEEAFMVLELESGYLENVSGKIRFDDVFHEV